MKKINSLFKHFPTRKLLPILNIGAILLILLILGYIGVVGYTSWATDTLTDPTIGNYVSTIIDFTPWLFPFYVVIVVNIIAIWCMYKKQNLTDMDLFYSLFGFYLFFLPFLYVIMYITASVEWLLFFFVVILVLFLLYRNVLHKVSVVFFILSFLVMIHSFLGNFEESYCWNKGTQEGEKGNNIIKISNEEAKELGIDNFNEVYGGYYAHMKCHKTFSLPNAIKDQVRFPG